MKIYGIACFAEAEFARKCIEMDNAQYASV